ncbi:hypothetical protein I3842_01G010100 [Carya illinoinensis]|uniref:Uncharacterized protein n=1 Tax=Carya illinoinensis TaxID=32201 RepID=A0A922K268_CARIL|nr:hypothetical protein I3842_01G010100 [Carya illinoinensis]
MVITDNGDQICEEGDNKNPVDSKWVIFVEEKLEQARVLDEAESSRKCCDEKAYLYLDAIKELEERAHASYDGSTPLTNNEFMEMMVLDGYFVIDFLLSTVKVFKQLGYLPNNPIFSTLGPIHLIQRDMIKLENQLPLFYYSNPQPTLLQIDNVVIDLEKDSVNGSIQNLSQKLIYTSQEGCVAKLTPQFFDALMPMDEALIKLDENEMESEESRDQSEELSDKGGLHCLDVFYQQLVHCVKELSEAGIKFKKKKTDQFWEITFDNETVLEIPGILNIHDIVPKSLLLNLVAFKQRHPNCSNYITSYAVFMDTLINSQQDVACLHYHGIIEHCLRNDAEVADLFNRLCQGVLSENVNKHFKHKWNVWFNFELRRYYQPVLKHKYFKNPWAVISLIAAGVLLLLTFLKTLSQSMGITNHLGESG